MERHTTTNKDHPESTQTRCLGLGLGEAEINNEEITQHLECPQTRDNAHDALISLDDKLERPLTNKEKETSILK